MPITFTSQSSVETDAAYAPQLPGLVAPADPRLQSSFTTFPANGSRWTRVIVPRTGTLVDLSIYVTASSGNIDVGVYSMADPHVLLYSTGSIACPAIGAWRVVGDPNIAVTAGQQLFFAMAADNTTAAIGRVISTDSGIVLLPAGFWPDGVAAQTKLSAIISTANFPLGASVAYATPLHNQITPLIIARVE